jgi:hypothetical protein
MSRKTVFKTLGIDLKWFAELLFVPTRTVYSWLSRGTIIPMRQAGYFSALERYALERNAGDLVSIGEAWAEDDRERNNEQKTAAQKTLYADIKRCTQKLAKLKQTESRLLSQGHLAAQYSNYLEPSLRENEETKAWLLLLGRKSKFEYSDIRWAIRKCEQQLAGLKAQKDYWTP